MSSDWSDTMVWFGQILLSLSFYHPIYMILDYLSFDNANDDHKALGLLEKRHGKVVMDTFDEGLVKR